MIIEYQFFSSKTKLQICTVKFDLWSKQLLLTKYLSLLTHLYILHIQMYSNRLLQGAEEGYDPQNFYQSEDLPFPMPKLP